jgi:hypothetical protein
MQDPRTTTSHHELALLQVMRTSLFYEAASKLHGKHETNETFVVLQESRSAFQQALKSLFELIEY